MTAWAHLPNAKHIDWVTATAQARPRDWHAAWDASFDYLSLGALDAAWEAAWAAAIPSKRGFILDNVYEHLQSRLHPSSRGMAQDAIAALIAWDDACLMLDMPTDAVRLLAGTGHHPAVLMLPAVIVKNGDTT